MHTFKAFLATTLLLQTAAFCDDTNSSTNLPRIEIQTSFSPFTGRATKGKVRMRTQAALDSPVVRELSKGELLIVTGETDDFYAVEPPSDIKGYVFRTFVLDNKVEGTRVNVRLSPNTDAPVIGQLNNGDSIEGTISPLNSKWLEIAPPANAKFYVAKEYLEKVGDPNYMAKIAKRRDEVNALLNSTYLISQQEFQKSFPEIHLDRISGNYQQIIRDYSDFPEQSARAKELLAELQENYVKAKIAYLEAKVKETPSTTRSEPVATVTENSYPEVLTHVNYWLPQEEALFKEWSQSNQGTIDYYYSVQASDAKAITGVLEPYSRTIKNKPGDFMLVDKATHQPLAFLYSTKMNLQSYVGREVTFLVAPRPNHNFAYPAFFVLSTQ